MKKEAFCQSVRQTAFQAGCRSIPIAIHPLTTYLFYLSTYVRSQARKKNKV